MELGDGMKRNARLAIYGTAATRIRQSGCYMLGHKQHEDSSGRTAPSNPSVCLATPALLDYATSARGRAAAAQQRALRRALWLKCAVMGCSGPMWSARSQRSPY